MPAPSTATVGAAISSQRPLGAAGLHLADDGRIGKAAVGKDLEHLIDGLGCAGHQQAARGLRIGQQGLLRIADRGRQRHLRAIRRPEIPGPMRL